MREDIFGAGSFHIAEPVALEVNRRVDDDQVIGRKLAANVIDPDGDELPGIGQFIERGAAATDQDGGARVPIVK